MTTGTIVKDSTHPVLHTRVSYPSGTVTSNGTSYQGYYLSKTWNGTDQVDFVRPKVYIYWTAPGHNRVVRSQSYVKGRLVKTKRLDWIYGKTYRKRVWETPEKRKKGFFDDHPYYASINIRSDAVVSYITKDFYPPYGVVETGTTSMRLLYGDGYSSIADPWDSNDDIRLIGKLRTEIAGSDFNAGVFLGESQMALKMILDNASKIARAYSAVKRGNVLLAAKTLIANTQREIRTPSHMRTDLFGDLSSKWVYSKTGKLERVKVSGKTPAERWLELQYGWLPLLKDVESGAEFLARYLNFPMSRDYVARTSRKHLINYVSSSIG